MCKENSAYEGKKECWKCGEVDWLIAPHELCNQCVVEYEWDDDAFEEDD